MQALLLFVTLLSDEGNWSAFLSPGGFFHSSIIQQKLITRFVPFLPLSRRHVERCVHSQLCLRGVCSRNDVVEAVGADMIYTPVKGQYFSSTGCKAVPAKINLFLWVEGAAICWYLRTERETLSEMSRWKETDLCICRNQFLHHGGQSCITASRDSESRTRPELGIEGNRTRKTPNLKRFWAPSFSEGITAGANGTHPTVSTGELDFTWK